ncbi:hypothetical protein H9Y04_35215 [Streptomyces sp. TRM66268-LWL]|uniref:Uncharacterized protein n=2 Tax=Streptomyces polyasparticus TaxID=2767826 RepID=A0ABR7SSC7_9ACTN|nr:hypothetical protein [Streptomyces polyasparticus]
MSPSSPPSVVLEDRIANHLGDRWPRLSHAGFSADLAADAMDVVTPALDRLRQIAATAASERDQARGLAVTLEQMTAEAVRLLRAGHPDEALAVLDGDAQHDDREIGRV